MKSIKDYINAKDQLQKLKDLYEKLGEEKAEVNDEAVTVTEAITEQEKQMQSFIQFSSLIDHLCCLNFSNGIFKSC